MCIWCKLIALHAILLTLGADSVNGFVNQLTVSLFIYATIGKPYFTETISHGSFSYLEG